MKNRANSGIRGVLGLALVAAFCVGLSGCDVTQYRPTMRIGESVRVLPVSDAEAQSAPRAENVMLVLETGATKFDMPAGSVLEVYDREGASSPQYVFAIEDLRNMFERTGCAPSILGHAAGAYDRSFLFCGSSFETGKAHYFLLKRPGQPTLTATSAWTQYEASADKLIALGVHFQ